MARAIKYEWYLQRPELDTNRPWCLRSMDSSMTNSDDDDDDDDECQTKSFSILAHIRLDEQAQCQHLAAGTTPCGKDSYYLKKKNSFLTKKISFQYGS